MKCPLEYIDNANKRYLDDSFVIQYEKDFDNLIAKLNTRISQESERLKMEYETKNILIQLSELLTSRLLDGFTQAELEELYEKGKGRYEKKIPPGFEDNTSQKIAKGNQYGDYVIWEEILRFAENHKDAPIVFVTGDTKKDWMNYVHGEMHGARKELITEFATRSNGFFEIISPAALISIVLDISQFDQKKTEEALKSVRTYEQEQKMSKVVPAITVRKCVPKSNDEADEFVDTVDAIDNEELLESEDDLQKVKDV